MNKLILLIGVLFLTACSEPDSAEVPTDTGTLLVVTSNYPLYFFTREIAGESVDLRLPAIEGDPAAWVPTGDDVGLLQQADLVILNGAGYEAWLAFTTLPGDRTLDTTAHVADRLLAIEEEVTHQHGPGGEHSHKGTAFTTWLDPTLAVEQARAIESRLSQLLPDQAKDFSARLADLEARLMKLDAALAGAFPKIADQPLIFSHPVYQYLEHRYGLNARSLHWEPGVEPGTRELLDFMNLRAEHPATVLLWEDQPLASTVQELEARGVRSVVFQPLANRPASGDFFSGMMANVERLTP